MPSEEIIEIRPHHFYKYERFFKFPGSECRSSVHPNLLQVHPPFEYSYQMTMSNARRNQAVVFSSMFPSPPKKITSLRSSKSIWITTISSLRLGGLLHFHSRFCTLRSLTYTRPLRRLISNLVEYVKFLSSIERFTYTKEIMAFLQKRPIFTIGHDKKFRPVIYVYPAQVKDNELELFADSVAFFLLVVVKHLLRNYFIENWIIVMDLEKRGFTNFPFKALQAMVKVSSLVFSGRLHKMYMLNPSFMFWGLWKILSKFVNEDTAAQISILKKESFSEIFVDIPKEQLIERYGGTMKEPETPFPLISTFTEDERPHIDQKDLQDDNFVDDTPATKSNYNVFQNRMISSMENLFHSAKKDWEVSS